MDKNNIIRETLEFVEPIYTKAGGNFTNLSFSKGEMLVEKVLKGVLKEICNYHLYDLKACKKECREELEVRKLPPIALRCDLVLVSIKTRVPIGKNDGAHSYVNIERIESFKEGLIRFKSGKILETLQKDQSIRDQISRARALKQSLLDKNALICKKDLFYKDHLDIEISLRDFLEEINKNWVLVKKDKEEEKDRNEDPSKREKTKNK